MNNRKATGPNNLPVEVWKSLGRIGVHFLKEALNKITDEEKIPDIWRKSILTPIFKNKGDIMNCWKYRGFKLMFHNMKLYARVHENRLRNTVSISEEQFEFVKEKSNSCKKDTEEDSKTYTVYSLIRKDIQEIKDTRNLIYRRFVYTETLAQYSYYPTINTCV